LPEGRPERGLVAYIYLLEAVVVCVLAVQDSSGIYEAVSRWFVLE